MKTRIFFCIIFVGGLCLQAATQSTTEFDYPDNIADTAKKTFEKQFRQGHALYTEVCSRCHNTKVKGKETIPDFSLPQLRDYEIRIWPEHREHLPDTKVTDKEMESIVLFLRYKKRNPPPGKDNP